MITVSVLEKYGFPFLIFWFLLLATLIAVLSPFGNFPDERSHYDYSRYIRIHSTLPPVSFKSEEIIVRESFQPPLYYLISSLLISPDAEKYSDMLRLRLLSILFGALSIVFLYKTTGVLFEREPLFRHLIVAVAALNPQFIYLHCGISNIAIATFTCALLTFMAVKAYQKPTTIRWAMLAGLLFGLCILSRIAAFYLFPVILIAFLSSKPSKQHFILQLLTFAVMTFAVAGWWYLRNWIHYGDPFLFGVVKATVGSGYVRTEPLDLTFWMETFAGLHASFWAYFGRNEYHATIVEYALYLVLEAIALFGLYEIFFRSVRSSIDPKVKSQLKFLLIAFLFAFGLFLTQRSAIGTPQGRYLYMAIVPLATLMGTGLSYAAPMNRRLWITSVLLFLFAFCNYLLIRYWLPHVI